jgi:general secretion pathway protein H
VTLKASSVTGVEDPDTTGHVVRFFPDGSCSGGQITVTGGAQAYQLQLDWLTGSIRVVGAAS